MVEANVEERGRFQFSVRSFLVAVVLTGIFFGLLAGQFFGAAFAYLAVLGIVGMSVDIVFNRVDRIWAVGLLFFAGAYAAANVVTYFLVDAFDIFDLLFMFAAIVGAPLAAILMVIVVAAVSRKLHWVGVAGFLLWMSSIAASNLWLIAAASASV